MGGVCVHVCVCVSAGGRGGGGVITYKQKSKLYY